MSARTVDGFVNGHAGPVSACSENPGRRAIDQGATLHPASAARREAEAACAASASARLGRRLHVRCGGLGAFSLVHDLGVTEGPTLSHGRTVRLGKGPLDLDTIVYLERCSEDRHPLKASPVIEERDATYDVHLFGVYWALHRMLRAALNDRPAEIESALAEVVFPELEELAEQPLCAT